MSKNSKLPVIYFQVADESMERKNGFNILDLQNETLIAQHDELVSLEHRLHKKTESLNSTRLMFAAVTLLALVAVWAK